MKIKPCSTQATPMRSKITFDSFSLILKRFQKILFHVFLKILNMKISETTLVKLTWKFYFLAFLHLWPTRRKRKQYSSIRIQSEPWVQHLQEWEQLDQTSVVQTFVEIGYCFHGCCKKIQDFDAHFDSSSLFNSGYFLKKLILSS